MSEEYLGVKFNVHFLSKSAPSLTPKQISLIEWCNCFDKHQLAPPYPGGSAGNLSFRLNPNKLGFIITGSRIGLKNKLTENQFVHVVNVDFLNKTIHVNGKIEPSSESMLHWAIYEKRPDVNAIFHGHSQQILNLVEQNQWIITQNEAAYGTCELVNEVIGVLNSHNFIIMKNHGFLALGNTMNEAGNRALQALNQE